MVEQSTSQPAGDRSMPTNAPTLRIRPRSAIADPELARTAVTDLPGSHLAALRERGLGVSSIKRSVRSIGRPLEPERVLIMPITTLASTLRDRSRLALRSSVRVRR
jgi:hypothetical protein